MRPSRGECWLPESGIGVGHPDLPSLRARVPALAFFFSFPALWWPQTPPPRARTSRHRPQLLGQPVPGPRTPRTPLWSSVPTSQPVACNSRSLLSEGWRWGNGSGKAPQLALFRWSTKLSLTSLLEPLSLHPFLPGEGGWHLLCLKEPSSLVFWAPHVKVMRYSHSPHTSVSPLLGPGISHLKGIK